MNRILRMLFQVTMASALATAASAGSIVTVTSDVPARVFLDGALIGVAPLTVKNVHHGHHTITVQDARSGRQRSYMISSPRDVMVAQRVHAEFPHHRHGHEAVVVEQPVVVGQQVVVEQSAGVVEQPVVVQGAAVVSQPVAVAQPVVVQQPVVVAGDAPVATAGQVAADAAAQQQAHDKSVTRNALLGAAAANEILNKGNSKGTLRAVTLGGALLNELAR